VFIAWFDYDPGPCPVDDAPHTTCVSPDYVPSLIEPVLAADRPRSPVRVSVRRPFVEPVIPTGPSTVISEPITTKTYRRKRRP
jgi:hypothetical protein